MKIFITGSTGYIGNEVAKTFARAGHEVFGLTRDESKAKELLQHEVSPLIGTLEKLPEAAKNFDVVIHCAFESVEKDASAVDALLSLKPKTLVYTSGVWVYGNQKNSVDETSHLTPLENVKDRPKTEEKVLNSSTNAIIIRPAHVYGYDKGLFGMLFETLTFVGSEKNQWTTVHVNDLANLYLLSVEKGLKNTILNGVESSVELSLLAKAISEENGKEPTFLSLEEGLKKFGHFAYGLAVDQPNVSSQKAKDLGWNPRHTELIKKMNLYYKSWKAFQ